MKNFQDEELPHELFLTTRQKTKMWNAFATSLSTDIKLSKAEKSFNQEIFWCFVR